MAKSVPVRCPACRREHSFSPPTFPCSCGTPITLPILRGGTPERLQHHTWEESWVAVRCPSCDRLDQWPHPELGCSCGAVLRLPVIPAPPKPSRDTADSAQPAAPYTPSVLRPAFRPVTIRTSRDAVAAARQYLRWLGFTDVVQPTDRSSSGVDLRAEGMVAQVDPTTRPTSLRDIECLWLHGLNCSAIAVFFSLAGYEHDARSRADELHIPLFVMDLTGTPQPVNDAADGLLRTGA